MQTEMCKTKKPLISVVTVTFNCCKMLAEQSRRMPLGGSDKVERVFVDGGSQDGCIEYFKENNSLIGSWISEKDHGIYDAMNKSVKMCSGEYIVFVNSDDWLLEKTLEKVCNIITRAHYDVIFGDTLLSTESGDIRARINAISPHICMNDPWKQLCIHPSLFVRKEVYEKVGLYDLNYPIAADFEMMRRLLSANVSMYYDKCDYSVFRDGGISSDWKGLSERKQISIKYGLSPFAAELCYWRTRCKSFLCNGIGLSKLRRANLMRTNDEE